MTMRKRSSNENHQNPAASFSDRDRCLFHDTGLDRSAVFAGARSLASDRHAWRPAYRYVIFRRSRYAANLLVGGVVQRGGPDFLGALSAPQKQKLRPASAAGTGCGRSRLEQKLQVDR